MQVQLQVNKKDIYVTGTLVRQPTRQGIVLFDDVVFGVLPGTKLELRFSSKPATSTILDPVSIDSCDSDQVLFERNNYYYCLEKREPDSVAVVLVYIAVAFTIAFAFLVLVLLVWKRKQKPINNATPSMCYTIVVGVILCAVSVTMWTKARDGTCSARAWLLGVGLTMILGAIFVRAYRLLWIFSRVEKMVDNTNLGGKRRVITNLDLGLGVSLMLVMVFVLLVVWVIVAPPNKKDRVSAHQNSDDNSVTYECDYGFPSGVFIIILIVFEALLLAFNCIVAFLTRNIPSNFNESKHVAFTVRFTLSYLF